MATMSSAVGPDDLRRGRTDDHELFQGLVVSDPGPRRRSIAWPASLIGHAIGIALVVLIPILWPERAPETPDIIARLIYNPPPPPPPPLPKGSSLVEKAQTAKPQPTKPEPQPDPEKLTAEIPDVKPEPIVPESEDEQVGDPDGSDIGILGGDPEGVEGGVLGGVVGGVIGGVVGGTGDGPVMDYDQPPRLLRMTQPRYPNEAFVKKIEGVVELEILIDSSGNVARARVVRSIPLLDAAAIACVREWRFSPAVKNGRPVATIARAPVSFRIF